MITKYDYDRLSELLSVANEFSYRDRSDLKQLGNELQRATIVESQNIPADVVTMNSKLRLRDMARNAEMVITLVFPKSANIDKGMISIISPVGVAILGYSVGDLIEWEVPAGKRIFKIEEILYQPEAVGDYHL